MAMMHRGRLDYIIGYPIEGQFLNKALGGKSTIESFPIEGMPDYFLGYIGCPKNEWGKEVITKINAVLQSHRNTPEYHAAYEFWLDENSIKRYREFVKEVY